MLLAQVGTDTGWLPLAPLPPLCVGSGRDVMGNGVQPAGPRCLQGAQSQAAVSTAALNTPPTGAAGEESAQA